VIEAVLFDFGETLVERIVDDESPLSDLLVVAYSDAADTLEQLAQGGFRLSIVSNTTQSTEQHMRAALRSIGLEGYFDTVVTSFDVGCDKPDPAIFRRALYGVGCAAADAAMVGNDPVADIGGAAALGMTTVLVARSSAPAAHRGVVPTFVVTTLGEIPALLR
jgi:putative hydrolase of the HAD superfamily